MYVGSLRHVSSGHALCKVFVVLVGSSVGVQISLWFEYIAGDVCIRFAMFAVLCILFAPPVVYAERRGKTELWVLSFGKMA